VRAVTVWTAVTTASISGMSCSPSRQTSTLYRFASTPSRVIRLIEFSGAVLVQTRPDRLLWGSDWPHLPDGQRDTGELLNLLAAWAPSAEDRRKILVDSADQLFFHR